MPPHMSTTKPQHPFSGTSGRFFGFVYFGA